MSIRIGPENSTTNSPNHENSTTNSPASAWGSNPSTLNTLPKLISKSLDENIRKIFADFFALDMAKNVHDFLFIRINNGTIKSIIYMGADSYMYEFIPLKIETKISEAVAQVFKRQGSNITGKTGNLLVTTEHKPKLLYKYFNNQIEEKRGLEFMGQHKLHEQHFFGDEEDYVMQGGSKRRRTVRKHKHRKPKTMKKQMTSANQQKMW